MKTRRFWLFMRVIMLIAIAGSSTSSYGFQKNDRNTKSQTEYLETFSRAYGYVKYFHPSDEADKID